MNDFYFRLTDVDNEDLKEIMEFFINDKIFVGRQEPVVSYQKNIWYESPHNSEHYTQLIQELRPIAYLLDYYTDSKVDWCLEKAISLFYLWYEENDIKPLNEITYSSDVVSYRLIVIANLQHIASILDLCLLEDIFERVLLKHCQHIKQNTLSKTNDAILQNMALYYGALVLEAYYGKETDHDQITSLTNLKTELNYFIKEDSSYLGHSLEEAYILYHDLCQFTRLVNDEKMKEFLIEKTNLLLAFLYAFLEPHGFLPPIGRSTYYKVPLKSFSCFSSPLLKHVKSLYLNELSQIIYTNAYFKEGNYFITYTLDDPTKIIKLIHYAAFHQIDCNQQDVLSFILYINQLMVFIDGGCFFYQEEFPLKQAIDGIYSHNTICVDGLPYPYELNKKNQAGLMNVIIKKNLSYSCGVSTLYDDVLLKRNILFLHQKSLLIIDEIMSLDKHTYEFIFNLNPVIKLKKKKKVYYGYHEEQALFTIIPVFSTIPIDSSYYYGNKKKQIGFYCHDGAHIEKNHTIIYKGTGKKALVITQILLGEDKDLCHTVANDSKIKLNIAHYEFTLHLDPYYNKLYLGNVLLDDLKNDDATLKKALESFYKKIQK